MKTANLVNFEQDLLTNGAATYNIETGEVPEEGYIVSEWESPTKLKYPLPKSISEFVKSHAITLQEDGNYLFGFKLGDEYTLQVVSVFDTKERVKIKADLNDQPMFFDLGEGTAYYKDKHGRWYEETPDGKLYEPVGNTYDAFHNGQSKQLKKIY